MQVREQLKRLIPKPIRNWVYPVRQRTWQTMVNAAAEFRIFYRIRLNHEAIFDFAPFEQKKYSQNGEDGILKSILASIGTTNRYFVEFGVGDGKECNSRYLLKQGWHGLQMDCGERVKDPIKKELITAQNINALFEKYKVPKIFDLLSIDVDGNDYWIWKALAGYEPRVVVIEYNSLIPGNESRTIPYDPNFQWNHTTDYFGASLLALYKLGREKTYTLIGCDSNGVNAFFVQDSLVPGHFIAGSPEDIYRPMTPSYHQGTRHETTKPWVMI